MGLENLEILVLSNKKLAHLNTSLFTLSKLQISDISNNETEALPIDITGLPVLKQLVANGNRLSEISPQIGHLLELRGLYLNEN